MQVERPRRPARSLNNFRILFTGNAYRRWGKEESAHPNFWPCLECCGGGRVRDPADRDVVEGYKLATWYDCKMCNGTGKGTKEAIKAIYDEEIAIWKKRLETYRRNYALYRSVLRKTTREEKDALEAFGIHIKRLKR